MIFLMTAMAISAAMADPIPEKNLELQFRWLNYPDQSAYCFAVAPGSDKPAPDALPVEYSMCRSESAIQQATRVPGKFAVEFSGLKKMLRGNVVTPDVYNAAHSITVNYTVHKSRISRCVFSACNPAPSHCEDPGPFDWDEPAQLQTTIQTQEGKFYKGPRYLADGKPATDEELSYKAKILFPASAPLNGAEEKVTAELTGEDSANPRVNVYVEGSSYRYHVISEVVDYKQGLILVKLGLTK